MRRLSLALTEEQEAIRRTARELVAERAPMAQTRALRDRRDGDGFSREAWRALAGLGLVGVALPEAYGGGGLGFAELGLVLEELGRQLVPQPALSTVVLGAGALLLGGTEAQRAAHLPAIAAGERVLAVAHEEGRRHARHRVATRATREAGGLRLDGEKQLVLDGHVAEALIVVARERGAPTERDGLTLCLVPAGTPGLHVNRVHLLDGRNAATVRLDGVRVGVEAVVGEVGGGAALLDPLLDRATIALAAEMLGGLQEAFDRTLAYLRLRHQFGVPIGSFQALQHRAARLLCEVEIARSVVLAALRAVDEQSADVPALASAAKARASDVFLQVANEAIQLHGGIGVTDEHDIGLYLKRARVASTTLGDAPHHRHRYALQKGTGSTPSTTGNH